MDEDYEEYPARGRLIERVSNLEEELAESRWIPFDIAHLPNVNQEVQIIADGKIKQAVFDYYCPISSRDIDRVFTWEIFRETGRVVYLPTDSDVTYWRPLPQLPEDIND